MGNVQTAKKVNYEDIQYIVKTQPSNVLLLNTLGYHEQECIIPNTIDVNLEEKIVNEHFKNRTQINLVLYGKNNNDNNVMKKYLKLQELGFSNIYIYPGGLFEWLCLQDIYGNDTFKTTKPEIDILKYKPHSGLVKN